MSTKNMRWADGKANPSGIGSKIFYIRKSEIKTWPNLKDEIASPTDEVTYEGDFEMIAGKTALEIYSTQGVGTVTFETVGEKDCKGINNKLSGSYPDLDDAAVAFVKNEVNANGIFIAKHFNAGGIPKWVVIGGQHYDPEITFTGESGAKMGDTKGLKFEVTAGDAVALPRYTGLITLDDGVYNCATDVFTPAGQTPEPPAGS